MHLFLSVEDTALAATKAQYHPVYYVFCVAMRTAIGIDILSRLATPNLAVAAAPESFTKMILVQQSHRRCVEKMHMHSPAAVRSSSTYMY